MNNICINVSSSFKYLVFVALLGSWSSESPIMGDLIMADLNVLRYLTSITTQGREDENQWITSYKLQHSFDSAQFNFIRDVNDTETLFVGNSDRDTKVTHTLSLQMQVRYVKLIPVSWNHWISLRRGLNGF